MSKQLTITTGQIEAANSVLEQLRLTISPEFLGLITRSGQPVSIVTASSTINVDELASLAAGSFAATRQLAQAVNDTEFTVMSHEGNKINVHMALVTDQILLVICFHKSTKIGKVRLITKRAQLSLENALGDEKEEPASK